jgi:hypothetical protein
MARRRTQPSWPDPRQVRFPVEMDANRTDLTNVRPEDHEWYVSPAPKSVPGGRWGMRWSWEEGVQRPVALHEPKRTSEFPEYTEFSYDSRTDGKQRKRR